MSKKKTKLKYLSKKEMEKMGRKEVKHEIKFDRKKRPYSVKEDIEKWSKSKRVPEDLPKPKRHKLKGVQFKSGDLKKLHMIHKSKTPLIEAVDQEISPDELLSLSYSAFTVHQYQQLKEEFKSKLSSASSKKDEAKIRKEWKDLVKGAIEGFQRAGIKDMKEDDLDNLVIELNKDKTIAKSIKKMVESGVRERNTEGNPDYAAGEIPVTTEVADPIREAIDAYLELCNNPIEDVYKWSYTFSWSWKINLKIWCPTWFDPWRFCWTTFTIAGISAGVSLNVGYRITCTGATAWGLATAHACATLLGIQYCFECRAEVVGVLGFAEVDAEIGRCVYGAGVTCEFTCTWRGIPVAFLTAGIGLVVKAPCPGDSLVDWAIWGAEKYQEYKDAKEEEAAAEEEEKEEEEAP